MFNFIPGASCLGITLEYVGITINRKKRLFVKRDCRRSKKGEPQSSNPYRVVHYLTFLFQVTFFSNKWFGSKFGFTQDKKNRSRKRNIWYCFTWYIKNFIGPVTVLYRLCTIGTSYYFKCIYLFIQDYLSRIEANGRRRHVPAVFHTPVHDRLKIEK